MRHQIAAFMAAVLAIVALTTTAYGQDATHRTFMATWSAIERGELETVVRNLDQGLPINYQDDDGYTLLHIAAKEGKRDIVAELLRRGANPGIKTRLGFYPYDSGSNYGGIVDMLVAAGGPKPPGYRPLTPPAPAPAPSNAKPGATPAPAKSPAPAAKAPAPAAKASTPAKPQTAREKMCEARWYSSQALCSDSTCKMREYRKWQTCLDTGSYY